MTATLTIDNAPFSIDKQPKHFFEERLIYGLRSGCKVKFENLYRLYAPALLGIISRIVKSNEVAEDLLQETFVKIWSGINTYDAEKGRLFTWTARIARNLAIDQLRNKAFINSCKNENIEFLHKEVNEKNYTIYNPDTIGLSSLTTKLTSSQKLIIDMIYYQGYTHAEVALELDIPVGTVKTKIRQAILKLRKHFT